VIPVLLLSGTALVKTVRFRAPQYIGDPINAVRVFDGLKADECVLLDIGATRSGKTISPELIRVVGAEANMALAVGGGITTLAQIRDLLAAGAEKVVVGTHAVRHPEFVAQAAAHFGVSTIVVCLDVKRTWTGAERVWIRGGRSPTSHDPVELARQLERCGAGELIIQSIDRDGTRAGYDLDLVRRVSAAVGIPVIALGGAGTLEHLRRAHLDGHASAVAAGAMFVLHGRHRGVLISYPSRTDLPF
jgi:cyclase